MIILMPWVHKMVFDRKNAAYVSWSKRIKLSRGVKTVAPASMHDIELLEPQELPLGALIKQGVPLLYAFDDTMQRALVTLHKSQNTILKAPFFYQGQLHELESAAVVESDALEQLFTGKNIKPTFIVSPGRVGSTLIANIFKYGNVPCLSEPDAISSFKLSYFRGLDGIGRERFQSLLKLTIESYGRFGNQERVVIKLRSYSSTLVPLFEKCIPEAKYVFLFRNISDWATSMLRAFNYTFEDLKWVIEKNMEALQFVKDQNAEHLILCYDELVNDPESTIEAIAEFIKPLAMDKASAKMAMARDSQAGTEIAKDTLTETMVNKNEFLKFMEYWNTVDKNMLRKIGLTFLVA